ncbi:hypothetical protein ACFFX0_31090 [Citricoccus parietis]|uniref:Uncharacterized protein n=1 Tax=Citricoccus parietis TaxID=592307 RepID=A0ABV5G8T6_9MICC
MEMSRLRFSRSDSLRSAITWSPLAGEAGSESSPKSSLRRALSSRRNGSVGSQEVRTRFSNRRALVINSPAAASSVSVSANASRRSAPDSCSSIVGLMRGPPSRGRATWSGRAGSAGTVRHCGLLGTIAGH